MASKKEQTISTAESNAATACLDRISKSAKKVQQPRDLSKMKVGEIFRQGDIYVEKVKKANKGDEITNTRQLVDGQTKGSRHMVTEGPKLYKLLEKAPRSKGDNDILRVASVAIVADKPFTIHHPEHAFGQNLPAGEYHVWNQMDYVRQQKVRD